MGMTIKGNLATSSPNHLKKRSKLPKIAFCTFWQQTEHWLFCCAPMTLTVKVLSYESRPFLGFVGITSVAKEIRKPGSPFKNDE